MNTVKVDFTFRNGTFHLEGTEEFVGKYLGQPENTGRTMQSIAGAIDGQTSSQNVLLEAGLKHGWDWFHLHAQHRMQAVNFFLIATAFLTAAYVSALRFDYYYVAAGIGILGFLISVFFNRFEERIRELIREGEAAIKPAQRHLAKITGVEKLKLLENVETPRKRFTSYGKVIRALHFITCLFFISGFSYASYLATNQGLKTAASSSFILLAYHVLFVLMAFLSLCFGYKLFQNRMTGLEVLREGKLRSIYLILIWVAGFVLSIGGLAILILIIFILPH